MTTEPLWRFRGGKLTNSAEGTLNFNEAKVTISSGVISNDAKGTMNFRAKGSLTVTNGELTNSGILNGNGATMQFSGGTVTNNANASMHFKDATVTISNGTVSNAAEAQMSFGSKAALTISGGELNNTGTLIAMVSKDDNRTTVEISGGKLTNSAKGTLNFNEANVTISSGTITNEAKGTMNFRSKGSLTVTNGELTNAGILNGNGATMQFSGGTVTNNANASMHFKDASVTISGSKVSNAGKMSFGTQGKLEISSGELANTGTFNGNEATVKDSGALNISGGKATLASLNFGASGTANITSGTLDVETIKVDESRGETVAITLSDTGVLQTSSEVLMKVGLDDAGTQVTDTEGFNAVGKVTTFNGGELALDDEYYNLSYVKSLNSYINSATENAKTLITMLGTLVKVSGEASRETTNLSEIENLGVVLATEELVANQTTSGATDAKRYLVIGTDNPSGITTDSGINYSTAQTHSNSVGGQSLKLGNDSNAVLVTEGKSLTLVGAGEGSLLVKTVDSSGAETSTPVIIDVGTSSVAGTLNLGTEATTGGGTVKGTINVSQTGTLNVKKSEYSVDGTINAKEGGAINVDNSATLNVTTVNLGSSESTPGADSASLNITNNANVAVTNLTGSGEIQVGEVSGNGATLSVTNLAMTGGSIFVDPYFGHSTFSVSSLASDTLNTNITAGSGALVIIGSATESEANATVDSLVGLSSSPSAVVYTNKAITIGSSGSIVIDPTLEAAETGNTQKIVVRNGGTLVIDQAALNGATVFSGATSVVVADEANFGVVNATIGTISLGAAVTEDSSATIAVYTDSPFLTASLANSTGIITIASTSTSEGQAVISSLGIQSMIRRADMILAETIADRAAEMELGSNLWVMVRGERYEQDGLDDGAGFHANMGYGAFGAEFAPNEKTNIGLAFQYGHGTVKGDVGSAKNKTKDYSATLYGSALIGDTGIKLLGEVAYTQSSNDITNTYYTGLNQDLDAKMISGGVTLLKRFDFDSFSLTPSIGARVSKIKTDAMKMGLNKLDKQSQTIVQVPIALRLAGKTAQTENGWSVTPRFKVAYIPTFGDKEIDIYGVEKTVLDTSPVQGAFGINFQKGGFSIDATANAGVGNRGTSAIGGKLEMNYRF